MKKTETKKNNLINPDMTISDVVKKYPQTLEVFFEYGLFCVGCAASEVETLRQGVEAHGINLEHFIFDLNKKIK